MNVCIALSPLVLPLLCPNSNDNSSRNIFEAWMYAKAHKFPGWKLFSGEIQCAGGGKGRVDNICPECTMGQTTPIEFFTCVLGVGKLMGGFEANMPNEQFEFLESRNYWNSSNLQAKRVEILFTPDRRAETVAIHIAKRVRTISMSTQMQCTVSFATKDTYDCNVI